MKETDLRGKTCVVPVAIAAGLGMAGMGLVSSGVVAADVTSVVDTLNIIVSETCTFRDVSDITFTGSAISGSEVSNFNNSGVHEFNLFCNSSNGYTVTATPYDLTSVGEIEDIIAYTDNYTASGKDGLWTAVITTSAPGVTATSPVPVGGGVIISSGTNTSASGTTFTAAYSAYVGSITPAGTYTGTIEYQLSSLSGGSSNSGSGSSGSGGTSQNDNSGNNGGGTDSGNEVTDNNEEPGAGDSGTGNDNSGTGGTEQSNVLSNPSNTVPSALNNTYNTYSTTNTYNTTNYSGGSTSVPTVANIQATTGESDDAGATSGNDDGTGTINGYEKPLGVTTRTSSSNEESGIDPMPLVVTAGALAVAGVAAIALAQNKKKEDQR